MASKRSKRRPSNIRDSDSQIRWIVEHGGATTESTAPLVHTFQARPIVEESLNTALKVPSVPETPNKLRVVILHGAHGGPDTNWFPWLEAALPEMDVLRPRFPTPECQSLEAWFQAYDKAIGGLPPAPTALVGHSLGAAFALRLVERATSPFEGVFLAAGFIGALGLPDYDAINASFFAKPLDWTGIRERAGPMPQCWAGDNDPYVPLARSREVAESLGGTLEVLPGAGHLNAETGFLMFPSLRDALQRLQERH